MDTNTQIPAPLQQSDYPPIEGPTEYDDFVLTHVDR